MGSISQTCLRAAFTRADPQTVKIQSHCQYLFALLGSAFVKALSKHVDENDPWFQKKRNDHLIKIQHDLKILKNTFSLVYCGWRNPLEDFSDYVKCNKNLNQNNWRFSLLYQTAITLMTRFHTFFSFKCCLCQEWAFWLFSILIFFTRNPNEKIFMTHSSVKRPVSVVFK